MSFVLRHVSEEHLFYVNSENLIDAPHKVVFFSQGQHLAKGMIIFKSIYDEKIMQNVFVKVHQSSVSDPVGPTLAETLLTLFLENKIDSLVP